MINVWYVVEEGVHYDNQKNNIIGEHADLRCINEKIKNSQKY